MEITVGYQDEKLKLGRDIWEVIIAKVLQTAACLNDVREDAEISVLLCDDEYIHYLNREYRGVDRATDVLSFALNEGDNEVPEEILLLGDVVISVNKVEEQANEYGHSWDRELAYLTVHGFLHILGYDHMVEEDKIRMREEEERVLEELGLLRGIDE